MGTWTRNFLVPKGDPTALRNILVTWLERKGFDLVGRAFPFADESEDERAVVIVSNAQWSVILYREAFEEGDRLLSELNDVPVVLETIIADSDVWGYELMEKSELTASFNSNPHYFGGNDQKLAKNGDPERLCKVLGMDGREPEIKKVQRRRSLFADFPCRTFCRMLGASAGALHFNDLAGRNFGRTGIREAGGWRMESLYFERRRQFGEEARRLILHSLAVREFEIRPARGPEIDREFAEHIRKQAKIIEIMFKPLQWVFMGLGPVFGWWIRRQVRNPRAQNTGDALLDSLAAGSPESFVREGDWLANPTWGVRIRVGDRIPNESQAPFYLPHEVFRFFAGGVKVTVMAIRPEKVRLSFTLRSGMSLLHDEMFFAGSQPARCLFLRVTEGDRSRFVQQWFVELEPFVLLFDASCERQLSPENAAAIKRVVQTLELVSTE